MLASRKTGIYREQRVRLSSYWFVLRQNETVNTHGLNHRTNRKTRSECGALKRAVLACSEQPINIEQSWHSIRELGPEKGRMSIWGGMRKKCKSWVGRKHWIWGNEPGHQGWQVGEELRGLSGNPELPSVWRFLRSFREKMRGFHDLLRQAILPVHVGMKLNLNPQILQSKRSL
jgi:hypothetical protein